MTLQGSVATVAYWLAAASRGLGYLDEALSVLVKWLPSVQVNRVEMEVHPDNRFSRRAAEQAGFVEVGERPSDASYADSGRVVVYEQRLVPLESD